MPYIQAKLTVKLDETQKDELQRKLTEIVSVSLSKPKTYIMSEIEDDKSLYMAEKKLNKGAYISIKMLGSASKDLCEGAVKNICEMLSKDYDIDCSSTYITFEPVNLWGYNKVMF